jgi:hypothetical protein
MRGSDHDTHPYRLHIATGGLSAEKIGSDSSKGKKTPAAI